MSKAENQVEERKITKDVLTEKVGLRVFIISCGNGGTQTALYSHRNGMNVYTVNTSVKDTDNFVTDESLPCFIIGEEGRGAGGNRKKAEALYRENYMELFQNQQFIQSMQDADIIVVPFACGGGTGSYIGPKIVSFAAKTFTKKVIIPYGIIPKNQESNNARRNTLEAMDEIRTTNVSYMFDDLNRYADLPKEEAYDKIGRHMYESIKAVSGGYLELSKNEMIDENDLTTVIKEPGYMAAYIVEGFTNDSKESLQQKLIQQIKSSPSVSIQKDGILKQTGVILSCPPDLNDQTRAGNYTELFSYVGGEPVYGCFNNYAIHDNATKTRLVVILSGMTFPISRFTELAELVKVADEKLDRSKEISTSEIVEQARIVNATRNTDIDKLSADSSVPQASLEEALGNMFP